MMMEFTDELHGFLDSMRKDWANAHMKQKFGRRNARSAVNMMCSLAQFCRHGRKD